MPESAVLAPLRQERSSGQIDKEIARSDTVHLVFLELQLHGLIRQRKPNAVINNPTGRRDIDMHSRFMGSCFEHVLNALPHSRQFTIVVTVAGGMHIIGTDP